MGVTNYEELVELVPEGHENAVKRKELSVLASVPDREVRRLIEIARANGIPICNFQDGKGYFISWNPKDISRTIAINQARVISMENSLLRPMKQILAQIPGQTSIFADIDEVRELI